MARLNVVDPATATGKARELFDGPLSSMKLNIFRGIANNPAILEAFLGFSGAVKKAGTLTPVEHELIALNVGQTNGCNYCLSAHTKIAGGLGVRADDAISARRGTASDPKHAALLKFTTAILEKRGFVNDEELTAFKEAGYNDAAVVEVVSSIAVNTFTNLFNHVNSTDLDSIFDSAPKI